MGSHSRSLSDSHTNPTIGAVRVSQSQRTCSLTWNPSWVCEARIPDPYQIHIQIQALVLLESRNPKRDSHSRCCHCCCWQKQQRQQQQPIIILRRIATTQHSKSLRKYSEKWCSRPCAEGFVQLETRVFTDLHHLGSDARHCCHCHRCHCCCSCC